MKTKYYIFGIVIVIILVGVGYLLGQKDHQEAQAQGKLEIAEAYYDFGTVGLDNVSHSYVIKNVGAGPLTIARVSTSCGCTVAQLKKADESTRVFGMDHGNLPRANFVLAPGEEAEVVATYNPLAHGLQNAAGRFNRIVYLQTENPRDEYELKFDITVDPNKPVTVGPQIEFDQLEHDFSKINKTAGVVETIFQVLNSGDEELKIDRIATSCACTTAEITSQRLAPGQSANLTVKFDPDFHDEPPGRLERTVTLYTNDPGKTEAEVKIYAEIIE